jgi:hypothetical protein
MKNPVLEALEEIPDIIMHAMPGYDDAIIGSTEGEDVGDTGYTSVHLIYSYERMIGVLKERDGMSRSDAIEWIDYNDKRAILYVDHHIRPIICYNEFNE